MRRKLTGNTLHWTGLDLAITTGLLWFIAKVMLISASIYNPPSPLALAVGFLFFVALIATCITILADAILKAAGR